MAQEILNVVFVNSMCSQSRSKRSSQIVPDNSSGCGSPNGIPARLHAVSNPQCSMYSLTPLESLSKTSSSRPRSFTASNKIVRALLFIEIKRYLSLLPLTTISQLLGISTNEFGSARPGRIRPQDDLLILEAGQLINCLVHVTSATT